MESIGSLSSYGSSYSNIKINSDKENSQGTPEREKVTIKEGANGAYIVVTSVGDKVIKTEVLDKKELASKYSEEVSEQGIDLQGTSSAEEAQQKYGNQVANNFYAIA